MGYLQHHIISTASHGRQNLLAPLASQESVWARCGIGGIGGEGPLIPAGLLSPPSAEYTELACRALIAGGEIEFRAESP